MNLKPVAFEVTEPTTIALLRHVGRMSGERRRPQLEALLAETLRELVHARRVSYLKVVQAGETLLSWQAVVADADGTRIHDDGINVPDCLEPLDAGSLAFDALLSGRPRQQAMEDGQRMWCPLERPESARGLVAIDLAHPPSSAEAMLVDATLEIFRNLMCLLDYSEVDTLTGLLNRKTFDEHLMQILASLGAGDEDAVDSPRMPARRRSAEGEGSHWLGVLDIDHFKRINDNFGHLIGDEVLLMVANLMRSTFRFRDKLFRFGGEEFVVVLKPASAEDAAQVFERFRAMLEAHVFPQVGTVTISIGFAPIRLHDQPSVILERADQALYWAKDNGRNRVAGYDALVADGLLRPLAQRDSDVELF